jgi:hypothetical protein
MKDGVMINSRWMSVERSDLSYARVTNDQYETRARSPTRITLVPSTHDDHIISLHDQRSTQRHAPENGFLVDLESMLGGHLVFRSIGFGGIFDEMSVVLDVVGQGGVVVTDHGRVGLGFESGRHDDDG